MKNTMLFNLKSGLGFALVALLSFGAVFSISAEDDESAEVAEEIVVTGSRIKRARSRRQTICSKVFRYGGYQAGKSVVCDE